MAGVPSGASGSRKRSRSPVSGSAASRASASARPPLVNAAPRRSVRSGHRAAPLLVGSGRPRVASGRAPTRAATVDLPRRLPPRHPRRRLRGRLGDDRAPTGSAAVASVEPVARDHARGPTSPASLDHARDRAPARRGPMPPGSGRCGSRPGRFTMGTDAATIAALTAAGPPAWVVTEFPSEQPAHAVQPDARLLDRHRRGDQRRVRRVQGRRRLHEPRALVRRRLDVAQPQGRR